MNLRIPMLIMVLSGTAASALAAHPHGGPARGYGDTWPRQYADTAIRQVRENHRLGCGYHGHRWTGSYRAHLGWAARTDWRRARGEIDRREADLRRCRRQLGGPGAHERHRFRGDPGFARWYADTALAQVRESRRLGCHLDGSSGRWSRSWRKHHRWALRQSRREALREVRRRDERLESCAAYAWRGR